jgi:hypothetical protein
MGHFIIAPWPPYYPPRASAGRYQGPAPTNLITAAAAAARAVAWGERPMPRARSGQTRLAPAEPMRSSAESSGEHLFFMTVSSLSTTPSSNSLLFPPERESHACMHSYATAFVWKKTMIGPFWRNDFIIMCRPNLVNGGTYSTRPNIANGTG